MIRFLGSSEPQDILNENASSVAAHRKNVPPPTSLALAQTAQAITSKTEAREDLGASLQSSIQSLAATIERIRSQMVRNEPIEVVQPQPPAEKALHTRLEGPSVKNTQVALAQVSSAISAQSVDPTVPLINHEVFSSMQAGSLHINGAAIAIDPQVDSLNAVIDRINQSEAGANASLTDAGLTLSASGDVLDISSDSTGFLNASNLPEGLSSKKLNVDGPLGLPGYAGARFDSGILVQTGSFSLNGVRVDVRAEDSLSAVVQRINESDADVTASWDDNKQALTLERKSLGAQAVELKDDSSGLLAALKLGSDAVLTMGQNVAESPHSEPSTPSRVLLNPAESAAHLQAEVNRVSSVLKRINVDPDTDPVLKAAIKDTLSRLTSVQGLHMVEAELQVDTSALQRELTKKPEAALNALDNARSLMGKIENSAASSSNESSHEINPSDVSSVRIIPGVIQQAEVVVEGRLMTLLIGLSRVNSSTAAQGGESAESARASSAYAHSRRSEHDPPSVELRSGPSPPSVGKGTTINSYL